MGKDSDQVSVKKALLTLADGGISAGVMVALGAWLGGFLDEKLHTAPWLILICALAGAGLGLARLVVKALSLTGPTRVKEADKQPKPMAGGNGQGPPG